MAKRRSKRDIFDDDYRKKGWNRSIFAPKNSSLSITQLSLGITFLLFISLYIIPTTSKQMLLLNNTIIAGVGALVFWIALAILIHRWAWRRVQPKDKPLVIEAMQVASTQKSSIQGQDEKLRSDSGEPRSIEQQLAERKARLQGSVEVGNMKPRDFEHEVAGLFNILMDDYKAVVVGGAGDGGVDIKIYHGKQLIAIIQCKRYDKTRPLSPGHVRELYAVKQQFGANEAYLVTTTRFTPETKKEAERLQINMIDGDELEKMRQMARETIRGRDERKNGTANK